MVKDYDLNKSLPNAITREIYACDDEWIREFLIRTQIGHVATLWEDQPFITPVLFWYDAEHHEISFHTNIRGRLLANSQRHKKVCFEASEMGRLLASNVSLEFSIQYESVVAFGFIHLLDTDEEKRRCLYGLIQKYFPGMTPGEQYRPITDEELTRTAVFSIAVDSWSGKRNWHERANQSADWPELPSEFVSGNK